MCETITCQILHHFEKTNNDIIVSPKEFVLIISCLSSGRNAVCQDCGKCQECKRIVTLLTKYREIEHGVRKTPSKYIVLLKFNKIKEKVELNYARVFDSFMEAAERNVFLV